MKILKVCSEPVWQIKQICDAQGWEGIGCGSELLVDIDDIFISEKQYIDGSIDKYFSFRCPVCGQRSDISEKKIPEKVCSYVLGGKRKYNDEGWDR